MTTTAASKFRVGDRVTIARYALDRFYSDYRGTGDGVVLDTMLTATCGTIVLVRLDGDSLNLWWDESHLTKQMPQLHTPAWAEANAMTHLIVRD